MLDKQQEAVSAITKLNQDLPQEYQNEALLSLQALQAFRKEINQDLNLLDEKANEIKVKFEEQLYQEGLRRGFLMKPL